MESPDPILVEIRQPVAIITFNRPRVRNPLSIDVLQQLEKIVSDLTARSDIRSLIFTGRENVFLSGADISELRSLDPDAALIFAERGQRLFQMVAHIRQKTIAAINGFCIGGGLDFALACDLRIALQTQSSLIQAHGLALSPAGVELNDCRNSSVVPGHWNSSLPPAGSARRMPLI